MAQIIKRGENKYLVRVFTGRDAQGKRTFFSKTIRGAKKDAQKFAREKETAHARGLPLEIITLTLGDYLDRWLSHCKQHVRPNTHVWYSQLLGGYVRPTLGKSKLAQLKTLDFEDLYSRLLAQGLSGRTVRHVHARLSTAFKQAVKWEVLPKNPVALATAPAIEKKEMHFLSPQEAARFVTASRDDALGVLFRFALATGLRPEEFLGLQWKDLELDNPKRGVAHVRRAAVWSRAKGRAWWFSDLKSKSSARDVYFPLSLARELQEHRRRQMEQRLRLGRAYENHDLVFPCGTGIPLHPQFINDYHFKPTLKRAELPAGVRLYDLRHSFVTLSLLSGVSVKVVSEQAGHASVEFTLDNYAHVLPEEREGASDKLESLLFSGFVTA